MAAEATPTPVPPSADATTHHLAAPAEAPPLASSAAAEEGLGHCPAARPAVAGLLGQQGGRGPGRLAALLGGAIVLVMAAELWIASRPDVPWLIDRPFFLTALAVQAVMLAALALPPGASAQAATCQSGLLDACHWVFVVMVFGGSAVLRAFESLLLLFAIAGATLAIRVSMGDECIMTVVAQRSSLPNISGRTVTYVFLSLLMITGIRLGLQAVFGAGFPIDQLIAAAGQSKDHLGIREEPPLQLFHV
ncbi:unnamed protein product [Prorocentrum cordatum]|uniref:Uncharacterized protein n=1 Tax=Prorocentrum cordatum TaxID=2364126 RepID=A0ABN9SGC4_9DINO|nr:unnamed protein product [Polarella glacialis]